MFLETFYMTCFNQFVFQIIANFSFAFYKHQIFFLLSHFAKTEEKLFHMLKYGIKKWLNIYLKNQRLFHGDLSKL